MTYKVYNKKPGTQNVWQRNNLNLNEQQDMIYSKASTQNQLAIRHDINNPNAVLVSTFDGAPAVQAWNSTRRSMHLALHEALNAPAPLSSTGDAQPLVTDTPALPNDPIRARAIIESFLLKDTYLLTKFTHIDQHTTQAAMDEGAAADILRCGGAIIPITVLP